MGRQALGRALGARSDFRRASMGTIGICHQHVEQNGTFVDHPPGSSYLGRDDPRVVFAVDLLDGRAGHVAPHYRFDSRFFSRRGEGSGTPEHGRGDGGLKRRSTRCQGPALCRVLSHRELDEANFAAAWVPGPTRRGDRHCGTSLANQP